MSPFGVDEDLMARIVHALTAHPKVRKVMLFGSRARGGFVAGSDIDLAVSAPGLSFEEYLDLKSAIGNLPIVFKVDLVHLEALPSDGPLAAQIARDAVTLFQAPSLAA
jgi:proline iminopeptidase